MTPRFEVFRALSLRKRFGIRLIAENGKVLAGGELYNSKDAARDGVEAIREAAAEAVVHDLTR